MVFFNWNKINIQAVIRFFADREITGTKYVKENTDIKCYEEINTSTKFTRYGFYNKI